MYREHFGLNRPPFKITPDTRYFYPGGSRGEVLEAIIYAILAGEGIVKVVGEVGSGKTMLSRMLELRLPEQVDIVYLANPSVAPGDVVQAISLELGIHAPRGASRFELMHLLQAELLKRHAEGRQVVCFVEEAQAMPIPTLEEIRLLSNLETHQDKLLQIVLFGQPELDSNLDRPEIRQMRERIVHAFHLAPFGVAEITEYVRFRMQCAGYRGPDIFTARAYRRVARASHGLVRRVNIIGDKALLAAYASGSHQVTPREIEIAVSDSEFGRLRPGPGESARWRVWLSWMAVAAAVALLVAAGRSWVGSRFIDDLRGMLPGVAAPAASGANVGAGAQAPGRDTAGDLGRGPARPGVLALPSPDGSVRAGPGPDGEAGPRPGARAPFPGVPDRPVASSPAPAAGAEAPGRPHLSGTAQGQPLGRDAAAGLAAASPEEGSSEGGPPVAGDPASGPGPEADPARSSGPGRLESLEDGEPRAATGAATRAGPGHDPGPVGRVATGQSGQSMRSGSPSSLLAERLGATRTWLQAGGRRKFSIQLMMTKVENWRNLERFLGRWPTSVLSSVYIYQAKTRGGAWYGVLFSEYDSLEEAERALASLPPELKRQKPYVRRIEQVLPAG